MRSAFFVSFVLVASCASQRPAPAPGYAAQCPDGPAMCAPDRSAVIQCERGQWFVRQPCPGPQGCGGTGGGITCDVATATATAAAAPRPSGEPCVGEGGYGCTADRRSLTICRGGRTAIASTCRGTRGCVVGNAV